MIRPQRQTPNPSQPRVARARPGMPTAGTFAARNHPDWRQYALLRVRIEDLPRHVRTVDVHKALNDKGNVVWIDIADDRNKRNSCVGFVEFRPPPRQDFWSGRNRIKINFQDGTSAYCLVQLSSEQPELHLVRSPSRPQIKYPAETKLALHSVDFGVLSTSSCATYFATRAASEGIQPEVFFRLKYKDIEVRFPSFLRSENGGATRLYRFRVALDQSFSLWKVEKPDCVSLIIHLEKPPWYWRKLVQQIAQSHGNDTCRWSEDDTWTRQTDIVGHKQDYDMIDQTPVSVRKNLNAINIARWTTFGLNLEPSAANKIAVNEMLKILQDYNVETRESANFSIVRSHEPDAQMWRLSDETSSTSTLNDLLALSANTEDLKLSFPVRYQLEVCISKGYLNEYDLDKPFLRQLKDTPTAKQKLRYVELHKKRVCKPTDIFTKREYSKPAMSLSLPSHCVEISHATVTATNLLLDTPSIETSNRVIRKYQYHADRFFRVAFEDDDYRGQTKLFSATNNKMELLFRRIKRALKYGITIGDRHYEFLAYGNSQLRERAAYFFASVKGGLAAAKIRADMGAFDNERIVAKRAARMGQCFSTTKHIHLRLPAITFQNCIPDVVHDKYNFTDGVGKISPTAALIVQHQLKIDGPTRSVFQFRLGGCKGILVLDPDMPGVDIKIRSSQLKFNSIAGDLEIIRSSEFWQACTNRQLIMVLSHLGVPDQVFLQRQRAVIEGVKGAMVDDGVAIKALSETVDPNRMTLKVSDMVQAGFMKSKDSFVTSLLHLWRSWTLKYLKEKAKIPIAKGALVFGCVDESGILRGYFENHAPESDLCQEEKEANLPEVFFQLTDPQTNQRRVIEGICAVARNPSLHPGDIRVVKAIDEPKLHHLCDTLVMPQTGDRDLASMCAGGDLDGDDYIVIWDEELIPKVWNAKPFHYDPPEPKTAEGDITTDHIIDFFYDYVKNDFLGRIAVAHLARADLEGLESSVCLELVQLHSLAVDYAKTGVPAIMKREHQPKKYPHFMEKTGTYKSRKILGQLYDAVDKEEFVPKWTISFDERIIDSDLETPKEMIETLTSLKEEYDAAMGRIMAQHDIKTEFEVWSTFVISHSKAGGDFKFFEEIGQLSESLKEKYSNAIVKFAGGNPSYENLAPWAVAAYRLTKLQVTRALEEIEAGQRQGGGMPFISFPWLLQDVLIRIATSATKAARPQQADPSSSLLDSPIIEPTVANRKSTNSEPTGPANQAQIPAAEPCLVDTVDAASVKTDSTSPNSSGGGSGGDQDHGPATAGRIETLARSLSSSYVH